MADSDASNVYSLLVKVHQDAENYFFLVAQVI